MGITDANRKGLKQLVRVLAQDSEKGSVGLGPYPENGLDRGCNAVRARHNPTGGDANVY